MTINRYQIKQTTGGLLHFVAVLCLATLFAACEKIDADELIEKPQTNLRAVDYVPVNPDFTGFQMPLHVETGFDNLIYVADSAAGEIVQLDQAGRRLGSKKIAGARSVTQDRNLDLLVIGYTDTLISGTSYRLSTIFRIDMKRNSFLVLDDNSPVTGKIIHPFYEKTDGTLAVTSIAVVRPEAVDINSVLFNGIATLVDNRYYVTRSGPKDSQQTAAIGLKSDNVLLFNTRDQFQTPISGNAYKSPFAITSLIKPPHRFDFPNPPQDFIYTSLDGQQANQVKYLEAIAIPDAPTEYRERVFNFKPDQADDYIDRNFRFTNPTGVEYTGDGTNYIFVTETFKANKVDESTGNTSTVDSTYFYAFNGEGQEGVAPQPAAQSQRQVNVSFGLEIKSRSVAYAGRMVYITDLTNGSIKRFRLTTDL